MLRRPRRRSSGETHDRDLDAAVRNDEGEELPGEAVLTYEREYRSQHQTVEAEDVKRAESEEYSGTEGEQRHHDVVGEDLRREQR